MATKKATGLAYLAVGALTLGACSSSAGGATEGGEEVTLEFMAADYSEATAGFWEDLIERFEAENENIDVDLEMVSWSDIHTQINTRVSTGEEPDILNLDAFASFAADDLLLPVEDVLPADTYDDLNPRMRDNGAYEGVNYGIPFIASARALFYNEDLLAQAGVEPPTTFAELRSAAQAVVDSSGKIGYGMPFGAPEAFAEFSLWSWNNGGGWMEDGEWVINSPENVEALEMAAGMYEAGLTEQSPWTSNRDDLFRMFGEGEIGLIQGAAFLPAVLEGQGSEVSYGIVASPHAEGEEPATLAVQDHLMVFNSTEHPEEAGEFLAFLFAPDNYRAFLEAEGMLPVTQSAAEAMADDPTAGPFISMLENARFYPSNNPDWPAVSQEALQKLGLAVSGEQSAQQVLDELQAFAE